MKRVTVDFSEEAYDALDKIATKLSITKADALRKSLSLMKFFLAEKESGSKVFFENEKDDTRKEVVHL